MDNKDKILIGKILEEIAVIDLAVSQVDEAAFAGDLILQRAIVMSLLNSGELAKSISDELKNTYKQIPWKQIIGLRNVAAHGYSVLSMADIWKTATEDVPVLEKELKNILSK